MRYVRIEIAGSGGVSAAITRKPGAPTIEVEIRRASGIERHDIAAGERQELWAAAERLHMLLEGGSGNPAEFRKYLDMIELLAA